MFLVLADFSKAGLFFNASFSLHDLIMNMLRIGPLLLKVLEFNTIDI
jgi:hypothetical protein